MIADPITQARRDLGVGLRRRDNAGRARAHAIIDAHDTPHWLTHREVAELARTTVEVVRAVRRERGETLQPTPIGVRLLRSMGPRHVAALRRLAAAHRSGSDMRTRAVLASAEMQQLLRAAEEAEHG